MQKRLPAGRKFRCGQTRALATQVFASSAFSSFFFAISNGFFSFTLLSSLILSSLASSSASISFEDLKPVPNQRRIPTNEKGQNQHSLSSSQLVLTLPPTACRRSYSLITQYGQSTCALFVLPQLEHLFNAVTSLKCLPEASCRCRFFICDVFFLGTALSKPSQRSPSKAGIGSRAAGNKDVDVRRRWRSGIRVVSGWEWGKSCARTIGRKAVRKDGDGARRAAIDGISVVV